MKVQQLVTNVHQGITKMKQDKPIVYPVLLGTTRRILERICVIPARQENTKINLEGLNVNHAQKVSFPGE